MGVEQLVSPGLQSRSMQHSANPPRVFPSSGTELVARKLLRQMPVMFRGELPGESCVPKGQRRWRIICYGDSLTAGYCDGGDHFEPYGRALANALALADVSCDVSIIGLSGRTACEMADGLDFLSMKDVLGCRGRGLARALDEGHYQDLALIMAGTNDLGKNGHPESIVEHLWRLHEVCHARGVPTIALTVPPAAWSSQGRMLDARLFIAESLAIKVEGCKGTSNADCVAIVDPGDLVPYSSTSLFWESDGLHYSQSGSRELGMRLVPTVLACLGADYPTAED